MFIVGNQTNAVYVYNLSDAYNISSASLINAVVTDRLATSPQDILFNDYVSYNLARDINSGLTSIGTTRSPTDEIGERFILLDGDSAQIYQFSVPQLVSMNAPNAGPYTFASTSFIDTYTTVTALPDPLDIEFSNNGLKMFIIGGASNEINEYSLALANSSSGPVGLLPTSFAITNDVDDRDTATGIEPNFFTNPRLVANFTVTDDASITGMTFSQFGTLLSVVGDETDHVYQYRLDTPYNLSSINPDPLRSFNTSAQETSPRDVIFGSNGTRMFIVGSEGNDINEYSISASANTELRPSAVGFTGSYNVSFGSAQNFTISGITFSENPDNMFLLGDSGAAIEYSLDSPYNVSSAKFEIAFSVASHDMSPTGLAFSRNGLSMFVTGTQTDSITQYYFNQPFTFSDGRLVPVSSGGGGSSGENQAPSLTRSFDPGTQTVSIAGVGIAPEPFRTIHVMDTPITVETARPTNLALTINDNLSWKYISHVEICINKQVSDNRVCDSDTKIIWDQSSSQLEIVDPNSLIHYASLELTPVNTNVALFNYTVLFNGIMGTSDVQIYAWDTHRNALIYTVQNALRVVPGSAVVSPIYGSGSSGDISTTSSSIGNNNNNTITVDVNTNSTQSNTTTTTIFNPSLIANSTGISPYTKELIIAMWAGYEREPATTHDLLASLGIISATDDDTSETVTSNTDDRDISLPKWTKSSLGKWATKNIITLDEFTRALEYLVTISR